MDTMPRPRPPHLHKQTTQHGKVVWYVRVGKGPRVRVQGVYGTPEFDGAYQAALNGKSPPPAGAATQANFMNQTSYFRYAETPLAQILEMPYAATGIVFDVLLPKTPTGLPDLEKSLTPEDLTGWLGSLTTRSVQVMLPKFRPRARS